MAGETTKADAIRYLSDTNNRVLIYHNHKETSAWGGVVFFYGFATVVFTIVEKNIGCKSLLVLWIVLTTVATVYYVVVQLGLRRYMGHLTIVLPRLCCRLFAMSTEEYQALDWNLSALPLGNSPIELGHSAPQFVIDEFNLVASVKHRARWWLEILPFVLIGVLFFALILLVLFSNLPHCWFPSGCHL